jgi:hypothetical protein
MNNTNFAEILDGLEKDVFDLVSNLERQINGRIASYGSGSQIPVKNEPVKPFQPKWRGLRGALRWLWKGHSRDNPDYAHLYDKEAKSESKKGRPTLAEYLLDVRLIDGFAEEICSEVLGDFLTESSIEISDLLRQFKMDFRNIILKYKNLVKSSVPSVAPASSGQRQVAPDQPEEKASTPSAPKKPSEEEPETNASKTASAPESSSDDNPPASSQAPREKPQEKDDNPPGTQGQEEKDDSPAEDSSESGSARKPKSHSANMGRWFKEALDAKKKGGTELEPNSEWLNPKGIIKAEKLPWVVAWMGKKSHKDLHSDEDVKSELQSSIGSSFKDFVPGAAKKKSGSLVAYLRKNTPLISDEEFKRAISELYGSEYDGPGMSSQKNKKDKGSESAQGTEDNESKDDETPLVPGVQGTEDNESEDDETPLVPGVQELSDRAVSSLYEGMDTKEEILISVEKNIVEPVFNKIKKSSGKKDAKYFGVWWRNFKKESMEDQDRTNRLKEQLKEFDVGTSEYKRLKADIAESYQEEIESIIVLIKSGTLFDKVLENSEISKNKPEKTITLKTLLDLLPS